MVGYWEPLTQPLLAALDPPVVVEVGAFRGRTTKNLLELAAERDWVVHSIDPVPQPELDVDGLRERYGERFVFHRALSLEVLPEIRDVDAVLLDGDHNWYTVYNELKALERTAIQEQRPFPLTLLHDVGWPYARRDSYYDPETIPEEYRQPHRKAGMEPGSSELVSIGGVNAGVDNALTEGGPRNGVRTAVEDFLGNAKRPVTFKFVPGFFGAGILVDEDQLAGSPALREALETLDSTLWLRHQSRRLEQRRVYLLAQLRNAEAELHRLRTATAPSGGTPAR